MISLLSLLTFIHLIGLILGAGAATVKLVLLFKCKSDPDLVPSYLKIFKPITRLIITGLILLTLSGIGWLLYGYPFSSELIIKLVLVLAIWIVGPVIDNVFEPKFIKLAPTVDQEVSVEFMQIQNKYLSMEIFATLLFYVIIVMWVLI